jgi:phage shock protein A
MELLQRLRRVTLGHIEELLAGFEDPEVVIPQLVREMEDQVRLARELEVQALADEKMAQKDCAELRERLSRLGSGAEAALQKGEEGTARQALDVQVEAEQALLRKDEALKRAQGRVEQTRSARQQRQAQLDELRSKKGELVARARMMRLQNKGLKAVAGASASSVGIVDTFGQMETKIRQGEAEADSRQDLAQPQEAPLEQRLERLQRDAEVEKRLAAMKAKLGQA